jgi:hypothetical protein
MQLGSEPGCRQGLLSDAVSMEVAPPHGKVERVNVVPAAYVFCAIGTAWQFVDSIDTDQPCTQGTVVNPSGTILAACGANPRLLERFAWTTRRES